MGHVHSKKKRSKKIHDIVDKNPSGLALNRDIESSVSNVKLNNRLSVDTLERISLTSSYNSPRSSTLVSCTSPRNSSLMSCNSPRDSLLMNSSRDSMTTNMSCDMDGHRTLSTSRNNNNTVKEVNRVRESFSYEKLNVDDHPALTKLQNDQNRRLEKMEERMSQIRTHAMQEAERRKYLHLFRAKKKESPTRELLCEAKNRLVKTKVACETIVPTDDKLTPNIDKNAILLKPEESDTGEIIPVTVLHQDSTNSATTDKKEPVIQRANYLQNVPALGAVNLNDPKSILFLPFLLPIFIFWVLVRSVSQADIWQRTDTVHNNTRPKKRN